MLSSAELREWTSMRTHGWKSGGAWEPKHVWEKFLFNNNKKIPKHQRYRHCSKGLGSSCGRISVVRNKLLNHWEEIESGEALGEGKKNKKAAGIQLKSQWDLQLETEHPSSRIWWWLLPGGLLERVQSSWKLLEWQCWIQESSHSLPGWVFPSTAWSLERRSLSRRSDAFPWIVVWFILRGLSWKRSTLWDAARPVGL